MTAVFQRYFLPGLVFLAVVIGGGYSTGRELVQFFMPHGGWGGLLGMLVTTAVWSAVLAVSFELVRVTGSYDYKSFFEQLLGRGWFLFEVAYFALLVLVMAVLGAAAGAVASETLGLPALAGTLALMGLIGVLVYFGSALVEKVLALWAVLLYLTYLVIIGGSLAAFGDRIAAAFAPPPQGLGWVGAGITYAGYNIAAIPAVFFCLRHQTRRREAIVSGLLAGPIAMLPGMLFFVAMMGAWPQIADQTVPSTYLIAQLQAPGLMAFFQVVFFGVLVKTGTALLHAINERVARAFDARGTPMPRALRPLLSVGTLALSVFIAAAVGLVDLIGRGYGLLTYAFIALLIVPVLTVGVHRIRST